MSISIEIALTCTWFQKRLCWLMSSICQQEGDVPNLILNIAYPINNGNPTTETVCNFFREKGLKIKELPYDGMEIIQYRGLVRNEQLKQSDCEWILYIDADMTYSPDFFEDLGKQLEGELKDEKGVISASRVSLDKNFCKNFFNKTDINKYPCIIPKAGCLSDWPIFQISRNCGAGYFQLVNRRYVMENCGGLYVDPEHCNDWSWFDKGQKANSDRQFRQRVGGLKKITTKPQYHLNHERDNEVGTHLTLQR
jgi:hypothetical protein